MGNRESGRQRRRAEVLVLAQPARESAADDLEEWEPLGSSPLWEHVRDAFEVDDEIADPRPEYGDFWWEPEEQWGP